jgi:Protein of unknown function (DUF2971)
MGELVYKFLPADYALQCIEEKRVKVSMPDALNDIFDSRPAYATDDQDPSYLPWVWVDRVINQFRQEYGLLCLSKGFVSPLLWGHYAAAATGIALGFDSDLLGHKIQFDVEYAMARPVLRIPGRQFYDFDATREILRTLFGVKAESWRYEEEVRYVVKLDGCRPHAFMYFWPFEVRALREVLLGYHCTVSPDYVCRLIRERLGAFRIELYTTEMHPERFEVQRVLKWALEPGRPVTSPSLLQQLSRPQQPPS